MKHTQNDKEQRRIEALDYLRGFFIIVIIIDHLYRWPSFLSIFTGEGSLWANASDGFIIISGLLVGYIRGRKGLNTAFGTIAKKLTVRAGQLYLWGVGVSVALATIQWTIPFAANMPGISTPKNDWYMLIINSVTLDYVHPWIYFLHLYTAFLLLAIGAVWLLRHNLTWLLLILSIVGFAYGHYNYIEWLERQIIFFIPTVAGFYLDAISQKVRSLSSKSQKTLSITTISIFLITVSVSGTWRFFPDFFDDSTWQTIQILFSRWPMSIGAIIIAFVWFIGLFAIFQLALPIIKRYVSWLILPFGQHSLAAYVVHGIPILIISFFFAHDNNILVNSLFGVISIVTVIGLLKIPFIMRLLPR